MTTIGGVVPHVPIRRIVLIAYLGLVLFATLAPLSGNWYKAVSTLDKLAHVGLFLGVGFLAVFNLTYSRSAVFKAIVFTSMLAALIELVQSALPFRSGDWWDLWAGVLGAIAGALIALPLIGREAHQPDKARSATSPSSSLGVPP